jgi:hypothetical protein
MNAATDDRTAASAGITPAELALMRHAAARLSPPPAASGTASAADPFTALTLPFTPGPPGRPEWWHKPQNQTHYCF